jgi:UDP-N-acetylglucosamine 2-epimerase (non-hydrolysing)
MIDTLVKHKEKAKQSTILSKLGLTEKRYGLLTLHRPANVEDPIILGEILDACNEIAQEVPLIFPCHPRTLSKLRDFGLFHFFSQPDQSKDLNGIHLHPPFGYLEFLKLMHDARVVLTDSGGIQEETTILRVPCITLRQNTERPVTVSEGTNVIAGTKKESIVEKTAAVLCKSSWTTHFPEFWDGRAAERIVRIFLDLI